MTAKRGTDYYWLIFVLIAFVLFVEESNSLYKDINALYWPSTIGSLYQVNSPQEDFHHVDPMQGPIMEPNWRRSVYVFYEVDGIHYNSDNVSFGFTFSDKLSLVNAKSESGPNVKVYFNPRDPKEAVLLPGPKSINIALLLISLTALFMSIRQFKKSQNALQLYRADSE